MVVAGASGRLHLIAIEAQALGQYDLALDIERESRLLARPSVVIGCKGRCGRPVPEVKVGRPRVYCEVCRKPRTKVDSKPIEPATVES